VTSPLALVGGDEWRPGCEVFDRLLLELAGTDRVTVLPTAAGRQGPAAVDWARRWFAGLGATVEGVLALDKSDAGDPAHVDAVRQANLLYIGGGSPRHLFEVLHDSPLWHAVTERRALGLVVAGSSAGAMVLGPRQLGLVDFEVWPHHESGRGRPTRDRGLGIDGRTAALWDGERWCASGAGAVTPYGFDSLAEVSPPQG
jgi:cyanophycinase-like exopeptidase